MLGRHGNTRLAALLVLQVACGGSTSSSGPSPQPTPQPTPSPVITCSTAPVGGTPPLRAELVIGALDRPVDLQATRDPSRLYVVEQRGRIRVLRDRVPLPVPFLDISDRVGTELDVEGLLGLAFHPQFAENGRFFVNYTGHSGESHIAEFRAAPGADAADPATERTLLIVPQPFGDHNGGQMAFGSDGMLYAGLGDGGSAGDPLGNGQNLQALLGKILRLDVDRGQPYAIPSDNPFATRAGARGEIWALGLRNPWRFSFDRSTGDLYIGDVGQNHTEEVDVGLASHHGGENYGWNLTEGSQCFEGRDCQKQGLTLPVAEYSHAEGCAVSGGALYRGCRLPGYAGTYFYGDFCTGFIRSFRLTSGGAAEQRDWTSMLGPRQSLSSFGVDAEGEVYMLELGGKIYKIAPAE